MKIGFPTYPRNSMVDEIHWIGQNGFDFPTCFLKQTEPKRIRLIPPV